MFGAVFTLRILHAESSPTLQSSSKSRQRPCQESITLTMITPKSYTLPSVLTALCCLSMAFADRHSTCDGCFCIPPADGVCPPEEPSTEFSFIDNLFNVTWNNPIGLSCNPYEDAGCRLDFVNNTEEDFTQEPDRDNFFCVAEIEAGNACPSETSYTLQTYTRTEVESLESTDETTYIVTHVGPCGACSALQDLAVYLEVGSDLRSRSTNCGAQVLNSIEAGRTCYREDLGFTDGCAEIWVWNSVTTREFCLSVCAEFLFSGDDNNGPGPECALAECLQCDETNSGAIFQQYAARSRRASGILTSIIRNCDEVVNLMQYDPCAAPDTIPKPAEQIANLAFNTTFQEEDDDTSGTGHTSIASFVLSLILLESFF